MCLEQADSTDGMCLSTVKQIENGRYVCPPREREVAKEKKKKKGCQAARPEHCQGVKRTKQSMH